MGQLYHGPFFTALLAGSLGTLALAPTAVTTPVAPLLRRVNPSSVAFVACTAIDVDAADSPSVIP